MVTFMTVREKLAYLRKVNNKNLSKSLLCLTSGDMIGYNEYIHKARAAKLLADEFEKAQRN